MNADSRYSLSVLPGSRIALFHWDGPITLEDRRSNIDKMLAFCEDNDLTKLLIDGRDQQSKTGTLDSFVFAQEVPHSLRGLRVAVLHRHDDDALPFIETVAANRGARTRSFTDFQAARDWLEAAEDPES